MRSAIACALAAAALTVPVGAHAEPTPEAGPVPTKLSGIETGRLLIRTGRLEHARVFLEQAKPANEEERIERLFLLGQVELHLGMPERAAERFEEILALRPGLTRVRLELASAYYRLGHDRKARDHFSSSLTDPLPSSVETEVEGFLRRIDARRRWSLSVSASVLPETKRPERETVSIGGVPFNLSEDARSSSGRGGFLSGGASWSPKINETLRGVLGASAAAKLYRGSRWDDVTSSADAGLSRLLATASVSGGVRLGRRWIGGEADRRSIGPWGRLRWRITNATRLEVELSAAYRRHDSHEERDGWRVVARPRIVHAHSARTSIEAEPMFELVEAKENHYASRTVGLGLSVTRAQGGFSTTVDASASVLQHDGPDPLFGTRRVDRNERIGVRVLHRSLRYRGFTPYVGYSLERNRSNIPIHEFRIQGVQIGVSRRF